MSGWTPAEIAERDSDRAPPVERDPDEAYERDRQRQVDEENYKERRA